MIRARATRLFNCPSFLGRRARWNSGIHGPYAEKLKAKLAEERVSSLDELKRKLQKEGRAFTEPSKSSPPPFQLKAEQHPETATFTAPKGNGSTRKDGSPVKPLSDFFNVSAVMQKPHTVEQISALWTLYHASRSSGTGRGYLSAIVPLQSYEAMTDRARKWPMFVLPLARLTGTEPQRGTAEGGVDTPVEFHFCQWDFHPPPAMPSPTNDNIFASAYAPSTVGADQKNPPISTVLFTPLIQYKLHQSYAPPYLIITHYTDFAKTHGIVLLRGEITPTNSAAVDGSAGAADGRYMLNQTDAQLLAFGLQRFYLPTSPGGDVAGREAEELLRNFHERPAEFEWERLLKFANAGLS